MYPETNTLPIRPLVDNAGRTIDYLRLSITDRCNLRCLYCMPTEGVSWMPHDEVLRFEETLHICRIMATLGIKTVKVTGGEPLVRRGAVDFIRELKTVDGIDSVTMTSNGVLLGEHLPALTAAGLDAVNISLDTLDGEKFRHITRADGFDSILPAVNQAVELGLKVKINCVPIRGFNEDDVIKLAALAKSGRITVRFIELMPLGEASALKPIPADELVSMIEGEYGPMRPSTVKLGFGPAVYYTLPGFTGYIGLISAVTHRFCNGCNRLRLTAAGFLKPCLTSDIGLDLRGLVRNGVSDGEIVGAIRELVKKKPAGHSFGVVDNEVNKINMFRIGG